LLAMNVSYTAVLLAGAAAYGLTLVSLLLPEIAVPEEFPVTAINAQP